MTKATQSVVTAVMAVFGAVGGAAQAHAASDPKGIWLDDTGRGAVEIKPCGGKLCGYVVAVKNANDQKGCGKQIIGDAQQASGGIWDSGWIYSPERRKNYDVEIKPLNDGTLRVVGYAGTKLFSRTMIWRRAPADLQRCDVEATAPAKPATADVVAAVPSTPPPKPVALETSAIPSPPAKAEQAVKQPSAPGAQSATPAPQAATPPLPQPSTEPAELPKAAPAPSPAEPQTADVDQDDDGEKPGKRAARGGLKLGDLDLDKVITRTRNGNCKIDLPFVKVSFKCED